MASALVAMVAAPAVAPAVAQSQQQIDQCTSRVGSVAPDEANVFNTRGLVQLKLGAFDRAIADYGTAVEKNSKDADSVYGRGVAKLRSGDKAAARPT